MDDITWREKLKERRAKRKREGFILWLTGAFLVSIGVWYFFIYVKTPLYALESAVAAVERKDAAAFRRYVNLELLTAKAYDDLTLDLFAYDATLTPRSKIMFERFYQLVKPELTAGAAATIEARVQSGLWQLPGGVDILKGRQLGIDYERFLERSHLRNTSLVKLGHITHQGTTALAEIEVKEDYTAASFTLQLVMEEKDSGDWQVAYIKNYKDYLNTVGSLLGEDLAGYIAATKNIVAEANGIFQAQQVKFQNLTKTATGELSQQQREALIKLIEGEVMPTLKKRQERLKEIPIPPGAVYLAKQREDCTEISLNAWQHFVRGLKENSAAEFHIAESLHKEELEIDLRVEDIIKHTAVSKDMPNEP